MSRTTDELVGELRAYGLTFPGAHGKAPWPEHDDLAVASDTARQRAARRLHHLRRGGWKELGGGKRRELDLGDPPDAVVPDPGGVHHVPSLPCAASERIGAGDHSQHARHGQPRRTLASRLRSP